MLRLKNLNALVTGGGAGIGRAVCVRLAQEGASVVVGDYNDADGQETVELIQKDGGKASFKHVDCSSEDSVREFVSEAAKDGLDVVVNNAAAFWFGPLEKATAADWKRLLDTNVIGYSNVIRESLPHLRERGGGAVVNMASVSSFIAQPEMFMYNATKGAVMQLTRCLAMDLAKDNIRVNAVCPGAIFTPASRNHMKYLGMTVEEGLKEFGSAALMNRIGQPEEVAAAAAFLASNDASFITGQQITVDGGATLD